MKSSTSKAWYADRVFRMQPTGIFLLRRMGGSSLPSQCQTQGVFDSVEPFWAPKHCAQKNEKRHFKNN